MTSHAQNRPGLRASEEAVAQYRGEEEALAEIEEAANRDPVVFAKRIPKFVALLCQEHNDYVNYLLTRFGAQYRGRLIGSEFRFRTTSVVNPTRSPQTRREKSLYKTARHETHPRDTGRL